MKVIGPDGQEAEMSLEEADKLMSLSYFQEAGGWYVHMKMAVASEEQALHIIGLFDQLFPVMLLNLGAPNV